MTSSARPRSKVCDGLPGAYFAEARQAFQRAVQSAGGSNDVMLCVAGIRIRFCFAGDVAKQMIFPTLSHLVTNSAERPQWTFHCWDDASTGSAMPVPTSQMKADHQRNCLHMVSDHRYAAFYQEWMEALTFVDREGEAYACYLDASVLPMYEKAAPLRQIFNTVLNLSGRQIIHAACVGNDCGSVVIAGPPRSGKSTLAVQCLLHGMQYQADDLCILSQDIPPRSWSLYNIAKIRADSLARVGCNLPLQEFIEGEERKFFIHVDRVFPHQMLPAAPVRALLIPHITGESVSRLTPASKLDGMRALIPYSISEVPAADHLGEKILLNALRHLPTYHLALSSDAAQTCGLLGDLLHGK